MNRSIVLYFLVWAIGLFTLHGSLWIVEKNYEHRNSVNECKYYSGPIKNKIFRRGQMVTGIDDGRWNLMGQTAPLAKARVLATQGPQRMKSFSFSNPDKCKWEAPCAF